MKNFLFIFSFFFLLSCYQVDKPKKPDNLIAKDKMVHILMDMSVLNSAKGVNKKLLENKAIDLQQYVFDKYEIDSVQFATSNHYYAYQLEDYKEIYSKVKDSLEVLKEKYMAIESAAVRKKIKADSMKRANDPNKSTLELSQEPKSRKLEPRKKKVYREVVD